MPFYWNPIYMVNLLFCLIILSIGYWCYRKSGYLLSLLVGVAFGLWGFSHLAVLLGLQIELETVLIIIRVVAYLMVIYGLWLTMKKAKQGKESHLLICPQCKNRIQRNWNICPYCNNKLK